MKKEVKQFIKGKQVPSGKGFNITAIDTDGFSTSTQVWGSPKDAAATVLKWVKEGLDENETWRKPYVRAFITRIEEKSYTTYEFDLLNPVDILALGWTAEVQNPNNC